MSETITLEVLRYLPEDGAEPAFQSYDVPLRADWVVLDALNHIKDHIDGTLSYRWSCRMGVCGSCGMMLNGKPVLTCAAFLESFAPGPIRVEPMTHFPVVRDLVVEITDFVDKLKEVKPWVMRELEKPLEDGEYRQSPEELSDYKQYTMCINCLLCYAACPVYGLEPAFTGPAALALAQRYNMDTRDEGNQERMDKLSSDEGMWSCTMAGECSKACPKHVDPAGAIQRYKLAGATDWWKSLITRKGK
ncbi:MAG TPA: succinate dehydrogenase iron-sulfur subunit [Candidatus Latescibacteria bacterium]|jgi:fumarate reductase iron-sulfur subunit|nr:succinate dehydrogenase/fumarate reductase iron-sulfur subunit [Gemmatimonadaceae bacterium]MDP6015309.1 succinate dehydrogenase iron-sulfur subunit [Candidatus Latescibacterota bacterium]HJP32019.1 succinate dehydrogenase iron-sulfur subunit [Candidatus Latescibacterota bacterium]|tara:strand:- start:566 stop:1306 length:741 start_codon:yes stop_codon:yes gene_type:complete